jgi:hypothetical protein
LKVALAMFSLGAGQARPMGESRSRARDTGFSSRLRLKSQERGQ